MRILPLDCEHRLARPPLIVLGADDAPARVVLEAL
jgi:hypothetical protein